MDSWKSHLDGFSFDSFKSQNKSQEKAVVILRTLLDLLKKTSWNIEEPIVFWFYWKPWVGKTHLMKSFIKEVSDLGFLPYDVYNDKYFKTHSSYKWKRVLCLDDLFSEYSSIEDILWFEAKWLCDLLNYVYENKCLLLVSSNFNIIDLFNYVSKDDNIWRTSSRLNHLLATTDSLEIEGRDYREIISEKGSKYANMIQAALSGVEEREISATLFGRVKQRLGKVKESILDLFK